MYDLNNLPDPAHYAYRVLWSHEDGEYVGLVAEFPSLSWLDESPEEALRGIRELVQGVIKDMAVNGEVVPIPLSERSYSGKFMVRVSPELHARLVRDAAEQGVSLNLLANERLAASNVAGFMAAMRNRVAHGSPRESSPIAALMAQLTEIVLESPQHARDLVSRLAEGSQSKAVSK